MHEPETDLVLEAPGGLVNVKATCRDGKVTLVRFINVPCFVDRLDAPLEVAGFGTLTVDIAYGGDSFVILDAAPLGLSLAADEARNIAELGNTITVAANEQLGFNHPLQDWTHISFCQMTRPPELANGIWTGLSAVAIRPGKIDRSPCGTGCSARMAVLHGRGLLKVGEHFIGRSPLGSQFHCTIEAETEVGGRPAIRPSIAGQGFITGFHQHTLDPADPWPLGYRLSDTWPAG
jgi:proline racemase